MALALAKGKQLHDKRETLRRHAVVCGVLGAIAYFAKTYGFYFFLAHFTLTTVLRWIGGESVAQRRAARGHFALSLAVFAVLAGGWVVTLSSKYGRPIVSTSGPYNHSLSAPRFRGHPMVTRGFMAPRDARAIAVFEDPSFIAIQDWSPLASAAMMTHQMRILAGNVRLIFRLGVAYSPLAVGVVAAYLLFCVPLRQSLRPGGDAYPLVTLLLIPASYALILVEERYLFVCLILLALMGARVVQRLAESGFLTGPRQTLAWLILALSIAAQPAALVAGQYRRGDGRAIQALSARLASQADLQGNIASNREWSKTLYVAHHLRLRYFGVQGDTPAAAVVPDLARLGVRYYFI